MPKVRKLELSYADFFIFKSVLHVVGFLQLSLFTDVLQGIRLTQTNECSVLWYTGVQPRLGCKSFKEKPFMFVSKVHTKS